MRPLLHLSLVVLACSLAVPALAERAGPDPLPWGVDAASVHSPYAVGNCTACHDRKGPNPGPPPNTSDDLCFSCHDTITQHAHAFARCVKCHNAHDSVNRKLLRTDIGSCPDCHFDKR